MQLDSQKIALVTGASRGIGAQIAKHLAQSGWKVAVCYSTNQSKADEVVQSIEQTGGNALAVQLDYTNRKSIQTAIAKTQNKFKGNISILVNNGAIAQEKPFKTQYYCAKSGWREFSVNKSL